MKILLLLLLGITAAAALIGGYMLISSPKGLSMYMPLILLTNTPFKDFLIPGIILFVFVGLINAVGFFAILANYKYKYEASIYGGLMICGWIVCQVILIRAFSWLQVLFFTIGVFIILISYYMKGKWIV